MQLQLADSSVRHPEGITENVPVRVWDYFVPVDFVVLDMDNQKEITFILGRPFFNIADAHIDVGAERSDSMVKRRNLTSRPKRKQCLMIRVKFGPNPQKIKEVEVTPSQKDNLISFMKTFIKDDQPSSRKSKKKGKSKVIKTEDPTPASSMPPKKTKKIWHKKKKMSSPATTSLGTDEMTST